METAAYLLTRSAIGFDLVGPVLVLLFVKRRASWHRAFVACLLSATVGAFLISGTLNTLALVFTGDLFRTGPGSYAHMFPFSYGGTAGVAIAILALSQTLPVVALWSVVHPRSFRRVTNTAPAAAVQD